MINLFTVCGTGQTTTSTRDNFVAQVAAGVDQTKFKVIPVAYPATVPFNTSYEQGLTNLRAAIAANPGPFALCGYRQGAMVTSAMAKTAPAGLVGGVTFGNPMRQAGHTFPGCPDPGGHGIMVPDLLTDTPTSWWDFAAPDDLAACVSSDLTGEWLTAVFMAACQSFTGNFPLLVNTVKMLIGTPLDIVSIAEQVLPYLEPDTDGDTAHTSYAVYVPPAPGNTLTAVELAINHLNSLS
jgi:pimeloyl-ACP methyl ester carboxylesterase